MLQQLSLDVALKDDTTFDNFLTAKNLPAITALQQAIDCLDNELIYLWGAKGVGKTHLLQACCHGASLAHKTCIYLPLSEVGHLSPSILDGMESLNMVAIDEMEAIAGNMPWERALFSFYNRARNASVCLLIAAHHSAKALHFSLADLQSRLTHGLTFQVKSLSDEEKILALKLRAKNRGFIMPSPVAQYLLHHYPREMPVLCTLLKRLDQASMQARRKLTLAFVREVLSTNEKDYDH